MSIIRVIFLIVATMIMGRMAYANPSPTDWNGGQILMNVGLDHQIGDGPYGVMGSGTLFLAPGNDMIRFFSYMGPKFLLDKIFSLEPAWLNGWWIGAPLMGVAMNQRDTNGDGRGDAESFLVSGWTGASFLGERLSVFAEVDGYLHPDQQDMYGFYKMSWAVYGPFNIGVQAEEVNRGITPGAHLGVSAGNLHVELQSFTGFQDDIGNTGTALRVVLAISD